MKKLIITLSIFISLLTMTSCKKEVVEPNTQKSIIELETRFISQDNIDNDTYTVLQFGKESNNTEHLSLYIPVSTCSLSGINTYFDTQDTRRIEIYKNGDNNSSYIWMGEISVNELDSTFIINKIYGPNVDLIQIECENLIRLQIQE